MSSPHARLTEGLLRTLARVPLPVLHRLGNGLGRLADLVPNEARHIARVNMELAFPEQPQGWRRRMARRSLQETAKTMLELGPLWYRPVPDVLRLIRFVDGEDVVDSALDRGRGMLVIAPHLGAWELLQMWLAQRTTLHALYRPPRQQALESLITRGRSRSGATFWPATPSGVRALFKALRNGESVGVLPDQQPPEEGVFVPFFGHPAKTMTLFSKLARRSGAPVIIGWAERLPRGRGFRVHWRPVDAAVGNADAEAGAAAMNRAIEDAVRELPEQYQWTYRRYSRRPEGERNPYKYLHG
ncbi:MAG TPA: lysophospholipid acyltransferase family protein [Gammaproteobacteria bacterium]|nr:lysophospholipid acyltransferase family protein [Gammaproteobacteria bacterium]